MNIPASSIARKTLCPQRIDARPTMLLTPLRNNTGYVSLLIA
ncbi:hypothetical protein [Acidithiobacillus sp.]|nr:hypothetical protein [Acidithiobacillus sp.]MDD5374054.1 hypothetical protein [Acidithiobacillus sp.]